MIASGLVLAMDAGIAGGSISLIRDEAEIANHIDPSGPARAEDLLANIDGLLARTGTPPDWLDLIAVSAGPGSFTGIRIGLATALGLKSGLRVPMASISALEAMARAHTGDGNLIAVVPMGRSGICWQKFTKSSAGIMARGEPAVMSDSDLPRAIASDADTTFICHAVVKPAAAPPNCVDFGPNIAFAIGIACAREPSKQEPLFISRSAG